jgi:FtsP/CotA-like multicopper oxidase with cupredoxin domain
MRYWLFLCLLTAPLAAQTIVSYDITAAPGTVNLGPGYPAEPAQLYGGTVPGPVLRATVGDTLRVRLRNQLGTNTILHVHGQPLRLGMDGVPAISRPEIAPGQEFTYELDNLAAGTYWFHPHSQQHHQLNGGMYGVLIVDPANPASDPAYDIEQVIVLDDWDPSITGGTFAGHILNGKTSDGQSAISVTAGQKLRLRILNAAARTNYIIALDGHQMTVTHKDGNRVQGVATDAIPIGIGERYDVIIDCTNPGVWSLAASTLQNRLSNVVRGIIRYNGQVGPDPTPTAVPANLSSGALLNYGQLASYLPSAITATPDRTYPIALSVQPGPGGGQWMINGEQWPAITPTVVSYGETIQFNLTTSTPSPHHVHPMHMHGHFVRLMGTAGGTTHAPMMDTVLIRPSGQPGDAWSVQWLADNPGSWLYHCHEMQHMSLGMMTLVDYNGDYDGDSIADDVDNEPTISGPVLMVSDTESQFQIGNSGAIDMQWQPNEIVSCFMSVFEFAAPVAMPPYGDLRIDSSAMAFLGLVSLDSAGNGQLPYTLPNAPQFIGLRMFLQGVGSSTALGTPRLSLHQAFVVR